MLAVCLFFRGFAVAAEPLKYNRDVRPILAENCFACHGPDSAARKADLRLDRRQAAIDSKAIQPGDLAASQLIERIGSPDPNLVMPPFESKKSLTPEQKEILARWISEGAEYEPHWSLIPPTRPTPPPIANESWVRNPIDRFVAKRLADLGLTPAPEAERREIARRASLDLTGLPPATDWVDAFLKDESPDAYEKYVDRLLSSTAWGEHRARYWLDVARYADTHGIHFDNYREIWNYRDWVIGAFNRNLPFDQFTIEQLAGDLLPDHTLDQRIASGFNRCNITTNEGGAISEEYLVLYTRDRTETVAQTWLGLTAGCAVCHDHKFDPLSQREFYEMAAFFNNSTQQAMDGNIPDTPPILFVPRAEDRQRYDLLTAETKEAKTRLADRKTQARPEFETWLTQAAAGQPFELPTDGLQLHAPLNEGKLPIVPIVNGAPRAIETAAGVGWTPGHVAAQAFRNQAGGAVEIADVGDFDREQAFSYGAWARLEHDGQGGSLLARMDDEHDYRGWDLWLEGNRVAVHLVNRWPTDAIKIVTKAKIKSNEWRHLFVTYDGSGKAAGLSIYIDGARQEVDVHVDSLAGSLRTTVPLKLTQRHTASRVEDVGLQDLRIYSRLLSGEEVSRLAKGTRAAWLVGKPAAERSTAETDELYDGWLVERDGPTRELTAQLTKLDKESSEIKSRGGVAHVMQERESPAMANILFRGEYDQRRDEVKPSVPQFLPAFPADLSRDRLGFARWLVRPEHPLTARVTVNRFWQEVFGVGIVRSAGDFGVSGELPLNPELLDWLAVEFRESGWDVKKLFRLMVTSATYRQSAASTPEKLEKDPQNRNLSRGPRFRMDAEMLRDQALAVGGLLSGKIGGPSVKPYQPEGVWEAVAMIGSNTRDYTQDHGEDLYRRGLYTFWKRSAPPASLETFNAPSREVCAVRRERTNTPLQALVTLNDTQYVEAARALAQLTLLKGGASEAERLKYMSERLLIRPLRDEEASIASGTLAELLAYYQGHPDQARELLAVGESKAPAELDPATLAAWTMLANELMNLDEVLNK